MVLCIVVNNKSPFDIQLLPAQLIDKLKLCEQRLNELMETGSYLPLKQYVSVCVFVSILRNVIVFFVVCRTSINHAV
jgi:hypothetical protein